MLYESPLGETPEEAVRSAYLAGAEMITVGGHAATEVERHDAVQKVRVAKRIVERLRLTSEEDLVCSFAGYLARGGTVTVCPPTPNGYYPPTIQQLREIQRLEFLG